MISYGVNMRQDKRTREYLAVIPTSYDQGRGRYYMALTEAGGEWAELSPEYVTRQTRTVTAYPEWLKRQLDTRTGCIRTVVSRVKG